jgi:transmembrane sensor
VPALLAAGIVIGLWGPNLVRPPPPAWTTYISIKGQIRRVKLADHSLLRLNGATAVKVMFEDRMRRADFQDGEAEFNVASNGRPFLLSVGDREIRTRNADFNLRRYGRLDGAGATLTLRGGQAEVGQPGGRDTTRPLAAGDQLTWTEGQIAPPVQRVDPAIAFAWQSHRLIYRQTPLSAVVADFNRYVDRPIDILDAPVGKLTFTGVVAIDSEDRMLRQVEAALPISAETRPAEIVLRLRAPCSPQTCRGVQRKGRARGLDALLPGRKPAPAKP